MTPKFKCDRCLGITEDPIEMKETEYYAMGDATVSQVGTYWKCDAIGCSGECDEVSVCVECEEWEALDGCDSCLHCIVESIIADPAEIENYTRALQVVIGKELARRCRPILTARQAA